MRPPVHALGLILTLLPATGCTVIQSNRASEQFDVQDGADVVGAVTWNATSGDGEEGVYRVHDARGELLGHVAYRGSLYQVEPGSSSEVFRGFHDMDGALQLLFGRPVRLVLSTLGA